MKHVASVIVNWNCLEYTKRIVADLCRQPWSAWQAQLIDQGSEEAGTAEVLKELEKVPQSSVHRNSENTPLNHIWNAFAQQDAEWTLMLNNDGPIADTHLKQHGERVAIAPFWRWVIPSQRERRDWPRQGTCGQIPRELGS